MGKMVVMVVEGEITLVPPILIGKVAEEVGVVGDQVVASIFMVQK